MSSPFGMLNLYKVVEELSSTIKNLKIYPRALHSVNCIYLAAAAGKGVTPILIVDLQLTQGNHRTLEFKLENLVYPLRNIYCIWYAISLKTSIGIKQHN